MESETRTGVPAQAEEPPAQAVLSGPSVDAPAPISARAEEADVADPSPPARRFTGRAVLMACCLGGLAWVGRSALTGSRGAQAEVVPETAALSVNTTFAQRKTLV